MMQLIAKGKTWDEALAALEAGKFARHENWIAVKPAAHPEYVGPVVVGLRPRPEGGAPSMELYTTGGVAVGPWSGSPGEFKSKEWQIVDLVNPEETPEGLPVPPAPPAG